MKPTICKLDIILSGDHPLPRG